MSNGQKGCEQCKGFEHLACKACGNTGVDTKDCARLPVVAEWEDVLFEKMKAAFEIKRLHDGWIPIDDTQVGVEFAIEYIKPMITDAQALIAELRAENERLAAFRKCCASIVEHLEDSPKSAFSRLRDALSDTAKLQAAPAERGVVLPAGRDRRIYIAGPMTGLPNYNFDAFNSQAESLRGLGYHVENPADHGAVDGAEWADYLRYDIGRLATCEAIFLLPGWSKSNGAKLEVSIGKALGAVFIHHADAEHVDDVSLNPAPATADSDVREVKP